MANEMEKQFDIKEAAEKLKKRFELRNRSRKELFKKAKADSEKSIVKRLSENTIENGSHLLEKMTIDIPGVRKRVISENRRSVLKSL